MEDIDKLLGELGKEISAKLADTRFTFMVIMTDGVANDRAYSNMDPELCKIVLENILGNIPDETVAEQEVSGKTH